MLKEDKREGRKNLCIKNLSDFVYIALASQKKLYLVLPNLRLLTKSKGQLVTTKATSDLLKTLTVNREMSFGQIIDTWKVTTEDMDSICLKHSRFKSELKG